MKEWWGKGKSSSQTGDGVVEATSTVCLIGRIGTMLHHGWTNALPVVDLVLNRQWRQVSFLMTGRIQIQSTGRREC